MDPQRAIQRIDEVVASVVGPREFHREMEICMTTLALLVARVQDQDAKREKQKD